MSCRHIGLGVTAAIIVALSTFSVVAQQAQSSVGAESARAFRTPWGEPDLQGTWGSETLTPMERPARFANRPVLPPEEAAKEAAAVHARPQTRDDRSDRGTEKDVAKAYNAFFLPTAQTLVDGRTGLIVDPPDGKIPPQTPEGQKREGAYREYLQALLQGTSGGRPGPVSPRRNEPPPIYNTQRMNRSDGPEDRAPGERCFGSQLPYGTSPGSFFRIVQSPGKVAIYADAQQGQGFVRTIPVGGTTQHIPSKIRLLHGDPRGRWEGDTLVVDTTNFSTKVDFRGSRENLHLIERFTRVSGDRINYRVTVEDRTTWTRPWTFEIAWLRQADKANQVYEPTCHEGNYGMIGMLSNTRAAERLFKEGKGPDPAKQDNATGGQGQGGID